MIDLLQAYVWHTQTLVDIELSMAQVTELVTYGGFECFPKMKSLHTSKMDFIRGM